MTEQKETCSICLDAINAKITGRVEMTCGHAHHFQCLTTWFNKEGVHKCPLCRKGATGLEDYAKTEPESESEGGWIRISFKALNTIILAQEGAGVTPEVRSGLDHLGNDLTEICRAEMDRILSEQGGVRFNDAQWDLMQRAFPVLPQST
jgi:hypothetical protein